MHEPTRLRPNVLRVRECFDPRALDLVQSRDLRRRRANLLHGAWHDTEGLRELMIPAGIPALQDARVYCLRGPRV